MTWLYVGACPTADGRDTGEGIWGVQLDIATGGLGRPRLLVETPAPSFVALAASGQRLYAVTEQAPGSVASFAVAERGLGPTLVPGGVGASGGDGPCHILAADGELLVSNYSSGTFGVVVLDRAGDVVPGVPAQTFEHAGAGPVPDRQDGSHAHSALMTPTGERAWVMDLGTDEIRRYRRTSLSRAADAAHSGARATGTFEADGIAVQLPPGTGPRHAVIHPDGTAFVVGELDAAVHVIRTDGSSGGGVLVSSSPACATAPREGASSFPSHVALNAAGTRLYVAVRGPDVVATFAVHADEGTGGSTIEHLADTSVMGAWPRHFAVVEAADGADLVVVANQQSDSLVVLRMDEPSGTGVLAARVEIPAPACVVA